MAVVERHHQADGRVHAVIVACRRTDGRWLLIRRSRNVRAPLRIAFPGGALEPGEEQADAVVREMREELELPVTPMRCLWRHDLAQSPMTLWGWRAELSSADPRPNPLEVEEVLWLTADEALTHPDRTDQMASFIAALRQDAESD